MSPGDPRRRRRRLTIGRRLWLLAASSVAAAAAAWWGPSLVQRWQVEAGARQAVASLRTCLAGASGDPTAARLRRTLVGAAVGGADQRDWPRRCAPPARQLELAVAVLAGRALERCGGRTCCGEEPDCGALLELGAVLATARPALQAGRLDGDALAAILPLARAADLGPSGDGAAPPPPRPAELLEPQRLRPLFPRRAEVLTDPPVGARLRLLFYEQGRRYGLCDVELGGGAPARCQELPPRVAGGSIGQLLASAPGAPSRLVTPGAELTQERWPHELFDPLAGRLLLALPDRPRGGLGWPGGATAVLTAGRDPRSAVLHRVAADPAATGTAAVDLGADPVVAGPELVLDEVLWTTAAAEGAEQVLHGRRLEAAGATLAPPSRLGAVGLLRGEVTFEPCATDQALAVLLRGEPEGYTTEAAVALRVDGSWRPPIHVSVPSDWFGLTCHEATVSLTWIDPEHEELLDAASPAGSAVTGRYRIERIRCGIERCAAAEVEVDLERHSRASRYVVGDLGNAVMLLWRSPLGDVRARVAPLEELPRAADRPLFDDEAHGGFAWEEGRGFAFARARTGVLVVKAPLGGGFGWYGLRLDDQGQAAPVDVAP